MLNTSCAHKPYPPAEHGDLIFINGRILTLDRQQPLAEALVVNGERIAYVGNSQTALQGRINAATPVVDLKGLTVIPGFNDNHLHAIPLGRNYSQPNLYGKNCSEIIDLLRQVYNQSKPGEIITAYAWDYPFCPNPHKDVLDKAFPRNPVFLRQYSGHAVWMNSLMLKKLGITKRSPDPAGGRILRDAQSEPTGIVRGTIIFKHSRNELLKCLLDKTRHERCLDLALDTFRKAGITSVQDNTWQPFTVNLLHQYRRQGKLTCRFSCWPLGQYRYQAGLMQLFPCDKEWIRKGPWKYIVDGAFSPRSAWMMEPYAVEPGNYGKALLAPPQLKKILLQGVRRNRQLAFHVIGDRAVHEVVNMVEEVARRFPAIKARRIRLEHAQLIQPADIPRIKELGLLVSAQPTALALPEKDYELLGEKRFLSAYPYRSLLKTGIPLSFGSDVPGETEYRPLLAIQRAVTRSGVQKTGRTYNTAESLSPMEALYCYTMGSAHAEFMEQEKGSLAAGKLADLVVLSDDLTRVQPASIGDIGIVLTMVGGKVVYSQL